MNDNDPIDIMNLPDYFQSAPISEKLQLLHRRKGWLLKHIRTIQDDIADLDKDTQAEQRKAKIKAVNKFIAEQSSVNELIKEFNDAKKLCIDQIILNTLQYDHPELFSKILEKSMLLYDKKNTIG